MDEKKCNGECGEVKPITEYYIARSNKDGRQKCCKKCADIKRKSYPKDYAVPEKKAFNRAKITCPRGGGSMISIGTCTPGCNPACFTCEHFVEDETVESLSAEEQLADKYSSQDTLGADFVNPDWG